MELPGVPKPTGKAERVCFSGGVRSRKDVQTIFTNTTDQGLKIKIEEVLTLVKEMSRGQKEEEEVKARKGDGHSVVQEVSHPSEPEKMLKDYTEAATEELSRKQIELSEEREKNEVIETQRNKKKSEEAQEDVEEGFEACKKREAEARRTELKKIKKKRRNLEAESVSPESISDTDL